MSSFEFLEELHEARMTRNESNMKKLSYTDCCERSYLMLLIIELTRRFSETRSPIQRYAQNSKGYSQYKRFQINGTDLHNFIYFVMGDDEVVSKLKDGEAAIAARKNRAFPIMAVTRYLKQVASGTDPSHVYEMFSTLESGLRISNSEYKSIRRAILSTGKMSTQQIKTAITKLLFAARAKLRSSDLIDDLERLATSKNFELHGVTDNEPTYSKPDPAVESDDLFYITGIVGSSNVYLAMKFLELAQRGETIPASVVKAFRPATQLFVDIVQGGSPYVSTLKTLQRQAKKSKKS